MADSLDAFTLPHSDDAESALIGSFAMSDHGTQSKLRIKVKGDDFYQPYHRLVWETACVLLDTGRALDAVTLYEALKDTGRASEIGGLAGMAQILQSVPSAHNGEHYADRVVELSQRRAAISSTRRTLSRLEQQNTAGEVNDAIRAGAADLMAIHGRRVDLRIWKLEEALHEWMDERETGRNPAQLTGIPDLDDFTGILSYGGYTIVGGRPSQGKSTFIRWLLAELAAQGTPVGLVAVEENKHKIAGNYISAKTSLENDHVAYHHLTTPEWKQIAAGVGEMSSLPFYGCDTAFDLSAVCAAAEAMVIQYGCKVIAVDHIHLMKHSKSREGKSSWSRNDQITEMSSTLKELGRRYGVVLIVAAQLSRPDERKGVPNPPALTDLRESGSLEQDADAVLMVHREDYYRRNEAPTGECRIGIEKNRNGKIGFVTLKAELKYQRFATAYRDPFA